MSATARRLAELLSIIDTIDPSRDEGQPTDNYHTRNKLVWRAVGLASWLGIPTGVGIDPNADTGRRTVAYIHLPGAGQVSWHMPEYEHPFDGHAGPEKTRRIARFAARAVDEQWGAL